MIRAVGLALYRLCLLLYPSTFRAHHASAMEEVFDGLLREARRVGAWRAVRLSATESADVARAALDMRRRTAVSGLALDVRAGLRSFRSKPGFTVVVIATLALGIGANTAIFSVVSGVLLEPLPYPSPDRVVRLEGIYQGGDADVYVSYPDFEDVHRGTTSFELAAAYQPWGPTLTGTGDPEVLDGMVVTHEFFGVLGVEAALGRVFLPEEDADGSDHVVVLSHGFWQRRMGADPAVVGASIALNGVPHTVVGVAPARFTNGLPGVGRADLWRPLGVDPTDLPYRGSESYLAIARLTDGATLQRAQAEVTAIMAGIAEEHPDTNLGQSMRLYGLQAAAAQDARTVLWVLLGAVGLVLAIAVANVTSLLLGRAADRGGEMALRTALGASRLRMVRQLVVEALVLSGVGALAGVGLAAVLVHQVVTLGGASIPLAAQVTLNVRVLGAAGAVALIVGVVTGLVPALVERATGLHGAIQAGTTRSTTSGARHTRMRGLMVTAQVALSVVLLLGAGLLVRSLDRLTRVDPGVRTSVVTFRLSPRSARYDEDEALEAFYRDVQERVRSIPGVRTVALTTGLPMTGHSACGTLFSEEEPARFRSEDLCAEVRAVSPSYFETMGIRVEAGRGLLPGDDADAESVVVINRTVAALLWPGQDPLGHRLATGLGGDDLEGLRLFRVVGVVPDVKQFRLDEPAPPQTYLAVAQWPRTNRTVVVQAATGLQRIAPELRAAVWAVDDQIPLTELGVLDDFVADTLAAPRFRTVLIASFALLAMVLAVVGLYGVVSYSVTQRAREIALRLAMGAPRAQILGMVLGRAVRLVAPGVLAGLGGALVTSRALESLLYEVSPWDPVSFVAIPVGAFAATVLSCYIPARRAVRLDPAETLRAN